MVDFYGTATLFRVYHVARDNDLPIGALDDDTVESWLLVASEWLDGKYRASFGGLKVGLRPQIREWPRTSAFDIYGYAIPSTSVPIEVEYASYEAALRHAVTPGILTKDYTPSKYKRASVDGAVSVEYAQFGTAADIQTQFTIIDQILASILATIGQGSLSPLSGGTVRA